MRAWNGKLARGRVYVWAYEANFPQVAHRLWRLADSPSNLVHPNPRRRRSRQHHGHVEEEARLVLTNGNSAQGDPYPARDHNVFLIYGDNVGPDDQVETNHEGNFVFPWLRPGDYTVYVYSEDTLGTNPPQDLVVLQQVSIESATETVVLDTLRVYKEL